MSDDILYAAGRVLIYAREARQEAAAWRGASLRAELERIAETLEEAAGHAIATADALYADAWENAGRLTVMRYRGLRKITETLAAEGPRPR